MKRLSVVSAAVAIGLSGCNLAHDGLHAIVDGVQAGQQAIGVHNNVNVSIAGTYRVTYETPDGASTFYTRTRSVPEAPLVNFTTYSDGSTHYELTGGLSACGLGRANRGRASRELPQPLSS